MINLQQNVLNLCAYLPLIPDYKSGQHCNHSLQNDGSVSDHKVSDSNDPHQLPKVHFAYFWQTQVETGTANVQGSITVPGEYNNVITSTQLVTTE